MASILLALALSVVAGLASWRVAGSRFSLNEDQQANDALNILVYVTVWFAVMFPIVFFATG